MSETPQQPASTRDLRPEDNLLPPLEPPPNRFPYNLPRSTAKTPEPPQPPQLSSDKPEIDPRFTQGSLDKLVDSKIDKPGAQGIAKAIRGLLRL